jgi:hypothetical protein
MHFKNRDEAAMHPQSPHRLPPVLPPAAHAPEDARAPATAFRAPSALPGAVLDSSTRRSWVWRLMGRLPNLVQEARITGGKLKVSGTSTLGSGQRGCATMSLPLPVSPTRRTLKCEAATVATRFAEHHGVDIWYSEERQLRRIPRFAQRKCRSRNHATPRWDCCVALFQSRRAASPVMVSGATRPLRHCRKFGAPTRKIAHRPEFVRDRAGGTLCCKGIPALRPAGAVLATGTWEVSHDNDY